MENIWKKHNFAFQEGSKTSQDASQMAFGPLLNRSWPLLLALGPLLAALASILVRLEPLLAALGSLWAPLGSLLGRSCPLQGRTRPAAPKFPQPASNRGRASLLSIAPVMGLVLLYLSIYLPTYLSIYLSIDHPRVALIISEIESVPGTEKSLWSYACRCFRGVGALTRTTSGRTPKLSNPLSI